MSYRFRPPRTDHHDYNKPNPRTKRQQPQEPPVEPREDETMSPRFLHDVRNEVALARTKHAPINSLHEGYAVILEELDEVWAEVRRKREERDNTAIYTELVQVAAMCCRVADDCDLTAMVDDLVRTEQRESWMLEEQS